ncbi:MAG: hypothetical protein GWN01_09505, partial [Nitrosopumilaceae archaeon]|nr:hypothetical protein [Nitrosopumilaceae archaeon]NIU87518.1 hypothetical protein [Nitrosopumilaceae archaeon]NIX61743.1 hypothetical protein [Nitrosopumilaceae archaeon]
FFSDALIQYDPNEAIHSDKAEEVREIGVVTDIYGIYANESNFGQDDAVVLQVDPNTENELFYDNIDNTIFFNSTYSNSNGEFSISDENKG